MNPAPPVTSILDMGLLQLLQHAAQLAAPVRWCDTERLPGAGTVQQAETRTTRWCGVILRADRADRDCSGEHSHVRRLLTDRHGEVVPRCCTGVAPVMYAAEIRTQHQAPKCVGKTARPGRGANLV